MKMFVNLLCGFLLGSSFGLAETYTAYSFTAAKNKLAAGGKDSSIVNMGGITHPVALILDESEKDVILVGSIKEGYSPVSLDDWAVALNAVLGKKQDPAVSIDRTEDTPETKLQKVRFEGGIENTRFGKDFLAADVVLKRLGLNTLSADVFGLTSYLDLSRQDFEKSGEKIPVVSRFWFLPDTEHAKVTAQDGLVIAEQYRVLVRNEIMSSDGNKVRDVPAETFAKGLYENFDDIKLCHPEISRLEQLYYLTALAQGMEASGMAKLPITSYWMNEFKVEKVPTLSEYPVEENTAKAEFKGQEIEIVVSGGIDFDVMVYRMQSGGVDEIKSYIIKSRPDKDALFWSVPLLACVLDENYDSSELEAIAEAKGKKEHLGTSILKDYRDIGAAVNPTGVGLPSFTGRPLNMQAPAIDFSRRLSVPNRAPDVGGVMLSNTATVKGGDAGSALGSGSFALVVDHENGTLSERARRMFATALWAVYFGREDPGISIDPIASGAEKQLVRYIGNVKNSDLGRVMREADYLMKKWAIGTERPELKSFMTPDDHAGAAGLVYLGAASRFWFVPQDMRFKVTPEAFLFDGGRMTVQTEFLLNSAVGMTADPSNEKFAEWFTREYHNEIVAKHKVFGELYDYAKLVALAKYLKDSGVPLYWFLMANKDAVLTEEAPGTVDALFMKSRHFADVTIEGGVDIVQKNIKETGYIIDDAARDAIRKAMASRGAERQGGGRTADRPRYVAEPVSFAVERSNYTAIPQHSSSSGKDRRGIRYQTDVSLRTEGFEITPGALAALEPAILRRLLWDDMREKFGKLEEEIKGLKPDEAQARQEAAYKRSLQAAQARTGEAIRKLRVIEGKFYPDEPVFARAAKSVLDDADQFELLGDILVSYCGYHSSLDLVRVFDPRRRDEIGDFGAGWRLLLPYRLKPAGTGAAKGYNLPAKMEVRNLINDKREILDFGESAEGAIGYFPADRNRSEFAGIYVLTDATFRLVDKIGCEFQFDGAGLLTKMIFTEDHVVTVDYLEKTSSGFVEAPYRVVPAMPRESVRFQNVQLPKRMNLIDRAATVRTFEFDADRRVVGWYPPEADAADGEVLALMSDLSYLYAAPNGNQFSFDGAGEFTEVVIAQDQPVVRRLAMGNHRITFKYSIDPKGNIVIAKAWVSKDQVGAKVEYVIDYQHDTTGRLRNRSLRYPNGKAVF